MSGLQQKSVLNISDRRKEYIEKLCDKCFTMSTGEKYDKSKNKVLIKNYEKLSEEYAVFLLTVNNYNKLKQIPKAFMSAGDQELSKDEHAYLARVCDLTCLQIMNYFHSKHGYSPAMFMLYYIFWIFYETDEKNNIASSVFKEANHPLRIVAEKAINLYVSVRPDVISELEKQSAQEKKEYKVEQLFPSPYIYFVYPNLYSNIITNIEEELWKQAQTQYLESKYLNYLKEMKQLYIQAYQFQAKQNQLLQEFEQQNQISQEEIAKIAAANNNTS